MTDTRTAFQAWHARAMELAVEYAEAVAESGDTYKARAALSAHLSELPMGEAFGFMQYSSRGHERGYRAAPLTDEDRQFVALDEDSLVPLYRHPKDTA